MDTKDTANKIRSRMAGYWINPNGQLNVEWEKPKFLVRLGRRLQGYTWVSYNDDKEDAKAKSALGKMGFWQFCKNMIGLICFYFSFVSFTVSSMFLVFAAVRVLPAMPLSVAMAAYVILLLSAWVWVTFVIQGFKIGEETK